MGFNTTFFPSLKKHCVILRNPQNKLSSNKETNTTQLQQDLPYKEKYVNTAELELKVFLLCFFCSCDAVILVHFFAKLFTIICSIRTISQDKFCCKKYQCPTITRLNI